jgi:hypothetical protein
MLYKVFVFYLIQFIKIKKQFFLSIYISIIEYICVITLNFVSHVTLFKQKILIEKYFIHLTLILQSDKQIHLTYIENYIANIISRVYKSDYSNQIMKVKNRFGC